MAQTTADIWAAAERLETRGERASVRNVRAELGGGDPGTIGRALKQRPAGQATVSQQQTVPDAVTRALVDWAAQIATTATASAQAELATTNEDYETVLAQTDDLLRQIDALRAELEAVRKERDTTQGALEAVQRQTSQLAADLAAERARSAELDQRLAGSQAEVLLAKETMQEHETLRADNTRLIDQAATAKAALEAATTRAVAAEARADQADLRAREAAQEAAAAKSAAAAAEATAAAAIERVAAAEARAERAHEHLLAIASRPRKVMKEKATVEPTSKRRTSSKAMQAKEEKAEE